MLPSRSYSALVLLGSLWATACSEGDAPNAPSPGSGGGAGRGGTAGSGAVAGGGSAGAPVSGTGGTSGTAASGGAPLAGSGGSAGSAGVTSGGSTAGGAAGSGGLGGDSGQGGVAGTSTAGGAGAGAGAAGAGGAAGGGGVSGSGGASGSGGSSAFSCPSGPFPAPMVVSTQNICEGFDLRYSWNEGPAWVASQDAFFFSNFVALSGSGGDIIKYTPGGDCERFMSDVGCNGLAPSNDGKLLAACQQTRSVVSIDLTTKQMTTIASTYMGMMLDTPNDLIQHPNGSIYFTNPTNELDGRPVGVGAAAFRIDPMGALSMIGQGNCNGIALSPDLTKLYVVLLGMWDLDPQGVPSNRETLFTSGDGMAVDCAGNVYANGNIFDSGGDNIGSWGMGTNLAFGGEDGKTVLVVGRGTALRELTVNVPGPP
jgi:sugar lactone lactonase YvrE